MISAARPVANSTAASRRCSSSSVPASLNSGTTMDNCGAAAALRDMTNAPSDHMREVVADQLDALAGDACADRHAAQERQLARPRREQARCRPGELVVGIARMHHELSDAGFDRLQQTLDESRVDDAGMEAADEVRRPKPERGRRPPVAPGPWPRRSVQHSLTPDDSACGNVAMRQGPS